jgi:hypothetical protein
MTENAIPDGATADTMSVGRDYRSSLSTRYEYVIYCGQGVLTRQGGFTSSSAAKRAGVKRAREINEASPQHRFAMGAN